MTSFVRPKRVVLAGIASVGLAACLANCVGDDAPPKSTSTDGAVSTDGISGDGLVLVTPPDAPAESGLEDAGADAGFSPQSVGGCISWFRADLGITLNGSTVAAWVDQCGGGDPNHDLKQTSSVNQPQLNLSAAGFANRPTVEQQPGTRFMNGTGAWSAPYPQPLTVYVAANGVAQAQFFDTALSSGELFSFTGASDGYFGIWAGSYVQALSPVGAAPTVLCQVFNGASSAIYTAASASTAYVTGNPGTNGINSSNVFAKGTGTSGVQIAEMIFYSGTHTPAQRAAIMGYMGARYGITIGP